MQPQADATGPPVPAGTVQTDGSAVARALSAHLAGIEFLDLPVEAVTGRLLDTIVAWARAQGWRVYRKSAPSVVPLPSPYAHRQSTLDIACARHDEAPIAIEVDHTDRRRTVEKLLAEATAGRIAIWVRWATGRINPPPPPVLLVTLPVTARRSLYSHLPDRPPPPAHTLPLQVTGEDQPDLFS